MRNKPPKETIVHLVSNQWTVRTSCGQRLQPNVTVTLDPHKVTCGSCVRTIFYKRRLTMSKHEATVGEPTQGSEDQQPIVTQSKTEDFARDLMARQGINTSFGPDSPLIHMGTLGTDGQQFAWCQATEGYSSMDLSAVNCRDCMQDTEFYRRNDEYTKMMSPSLADNEVTTYDAKLHDLDLTDYVVGSPEYQHDCPACHFLGHTPEGDDLYWCGQNGERSTVIARYGNDGPDYISGLSNATQTPALAMAVVRAFKEGLLTDDDMSWL